MLELVEEALDDVSLLVQVGIVVALFFSVALGRDDDFGSRPVDTVDEAIGVVAFVGDGGAGLEALDKIMGKGNVVALPGAGQQTHRIAERIAGGVDLGAQAAARPAQALGIRPPFERRAPAAC